MLCLPADFIISERLIKFCCKVSFSANVFRKLLYYRFYQVYSNNWMARVDIHPFATVFVEFRESFEASKTYYH